MENIELTPELQAMFPVNEPILKLLSDEDSIYIIFEHRMLTITETPLMLVSLH